MFFVLSVSIIEEKCAETYCINDRQCFYMINNTAGKAEKLKYYFIVHEDYQKSFISDKIPKLYTVY